MTTYAFPSGYKTNSATWKLMDNTQVYRSQLTQTTQTVTRSGDYWHIEATLPPVRRDKAGEIIAFFNRLRGKTHRFTMSDHSLPTAIGVATGTPRVNGASQTGQSLNTDGWTASTSGILKASDMFNIGSNLYMVTADASSNGSGQATLSIVPPLRVSPVDNTALTVNNPTAKFILSTWSQTTDAGRFLRITFTAYEDIAQ